MPAPVPASYVQSGPIMYDCAIGAIPFLFATNAGTYGQQSYLRETADHNKRQVDTTKEAGEQSIQSWWYRSQSSFHLGAGIKFFDPVQDPNLAYRFQDSCGVNVFDAGNVSLLKKSAIQVASAVRNLAVGYAVGGENGVLHASGVTLTKVKSDGVTVAVAWGGLATILDLVTDGGAYYVVSNEGIYKGTLPAGAGVKIWQPPAVLPTRAKLGYAKERLLFGSNATLYTTLSVSPAAPPAVLPTALPLVWVHPEAGWTWSGIADGPSNIYVSGYSGDYSAIYSMAYNAATDALSIPVNVAEVPRGEIIKSISIYLGTYLIVGTNLGVRVGIITSSGSIVLGRLSVTANSSVNALMTTSNFIWAAGSKATKSTATTHIGLFKIDLSTQISDGSLQFPWQRDVYAEDAAWNTGSPDTNSVLSICPIGQSGRIAYTIDGIGLIFENATLVCTDGYLDTGKIRFDTQDDKIFQFIRVSNLLNTAHLKVSSINESNVKEDLFEWDTAAIKAVETYASDSLPHSWMTYRFTLSILGGSPTVSPVFIGYQVKAQPANVIQRKIRVSLMNLLSEKNTEGKIVERSTWNRITSLEALEKTGAIVRYQDFGTGENVFCLIENIQFIVNSQQESRAAKANPGGIIIATLRVVS